jgi:uncharacterized protein (DUF58 family)
MRTRRVRTPLTSAGWATLVTGGLLCVAGRLLGYGVAISLGLVALAVFVLAGLTVLVRPNVRLSRHVTPDRITVGKPAAGRLVVRNLTRWPQTGLVVVDRLGGRPREVPVPAIKAGGSRTVHYPVPTERRGRLTVGPLTVERRDPFGLFRRAQSQGETDVLWVHPRVHLVEPVPVGTVPDFEGRMEMATKGSTSFSSLREYVPGDDPRRIHWRSTARAGELIVRESVDTMEPTVTIVLDTRSSVLAPEAFEHAVEVSASVAQSTIDSGRPGRVLVVGEDEAEVAAAGAESLLDRLAAAEQSDDTDPLRLLETVDRAARGGALVVVTGGGEPGLQARLAEQRRRFAPVIVMCVVRADAAAPDPYRKPGIAVLHVRTGVEAASVWNQLVLGGGLG